MAVGREFEASLVPIVQSLYYTIVCNSGRAVPTGRIIVELGLVLPAILQCHGSHYVPESAVACRIDWPPS